MIPIRVQRKRTKNWRNPPHTKYVGRGSKYGNRYSVIRRRLTWRAAVWFVTWGNYVFRSHPCNTRNEAIALSVRWYGTRQLRGRLRDDAKEELRGWNLSCWCAIGTPCHADWLLKIANEQEITAPIPGAMSKEQIANIWAEPKAIPPRNGQYTIDDYVLF